MRSTLRSAIRVTGMAHHTRPNPANAAVSHARPDFLHELRRQVATGPFFRFGPVDGALHARRRQRRCAWLRGSSRWSASLTAALASRHRRYSRGRDEPQVLAGLDAAVGGPQGRSEDSEPILARASVPCGVSSLPALLAGGLKGARRPTGAR